MKDKLILFEFDETLTVWDYKEQLYTPRKYMHLLISFLLEISYISIYNKTSPYLNDVFINRYLCHHDYNKVINGKPTDLSGWDSLDIHSMFCRDCERRGTSNNSLYVAPQYLSMFGDSDTELLLLKNYLQRKIIPDLPFNEHNFDDWRSRLYGDYSFYNRCNGFCKY